MAVVQPGQTLGPGKDKSDKLGQDEEWARIPELCFTKAILTPQASEEGDSLSPPSVKPMISWSSRSAKNTRRKAKCNQGASLMLNGDNGS